VLGLGRGFGHDGERKCCLGEATLSRQNRMPILRGIEPEMQSGMKKPLGLHQAAFLNR
jgi:hypothetical protein